MTFLQAKTTLCTLKLNTSYANIVAGTNQLFSLANIEDAINYGVRKAWDYKTWPFSEATYEKTGTSPANPFFFTISQQDFQGESAFLAIVNGVPWVGPSNGKRNFRDYMKWFGDYPTDKSLIWSEFGGKLYFNYNALSNSYDIIVYGKAHAPIYAFANGSDSVVMPFSLESAASGTGTDGGGNDAIITLAYSYILSSEKKKNAAQAMQEEKRALAILDAVWAPIAEGRSQNNPQNQPLFNTQDMFNSRRSTRSNTNIGNFP